MTDSRGGQLTFCGLKEECPLIALHVRRWRATAQAKAGCFDWTPNQDRCPYHRE